MPHQPVPRLPRSPLWSNFADICRHPHGSGKEEPLRRFLKNRGRALGLEVRVDKAGNVVLRKPATPGMEDRIPVTLQGHMDMVCEKNASTVHDFDRDPIHPRVVDGTWVMAEGTTLGADNGVGLAAALAVLQSKDLAHGPLEVLCTVDEERGLTGATRLEPGWIQGRILLNLDSEHDEEICIGCAGSHTAIYQLPFGTAPAPLGVGVRIQVSGLVGGHSGLDIHRGRGNAVTLLARVLLALPDFRLALFTGGTRRNAITREAQAVGILSADQVPVLAQTLARLQGELAGELSRTDPGVHLEAVPVEAPARVVDLPAQERFLHLLAACPDGVLAMDPDMPGLVRTSSNLATVATGPGAFEVGTSQRGMLESHSAWGAQRVEAAFRLAGARVLHQSGYPGWTPDLQSPALALVRKVYRVLRGMEPRVLAIHAGLECGLFKSRFPDLDMVSIGPLIQNPHSPEERVHIGSVDRFWDLLVGVLASVPRAAPE